MANSLAKNLENIRLAMIGMVDGNGQPYGWSASTYALVSS
jgi:hypothetical protein